MTAWSQTWTWLDGAWIEGNPGIVGPRTHAFWLGSSVFDGARAFEGVMPDLDGHLQRVANQFGNEYGDFVTAEKLGVGPHMPILEGAAYPLATPTGPDPNAGMKQASAQ